MLTETITTARLTMRRFTPADVEPFHAIMADPRAMQFWSTPPHRELAETAAWVTATIAAVAAGASDEFIVVRDGHVVGKAGLWQGTEIGFIFSPAVWGEGLASEAVAAVLARAWDREATVVTADVDPRNLACLRMLRRCGFLETGFSPRTFCVDGVWTDSVYLAAAPP